MKIYFACSLTGGRDDEAIYAEIVGHLQGIGHSVPTAHLADPSVMDLERVVDPDEVYARDVKWISEAAALIAEVSTPSHGVGYEIAYALGIGKPVLCCYRAGVPVSKMILGNHSEGLTVRSYRDSFEALELIDAFLVGLEGSSEP
jgi:nucleoside 2-deoxyribosyltransferase